MTATGVTVPSSLRRDDDVVVAAPHPAAVEAAREMVAQGGNAVDAAVAAAAALTVVYPHMCSVGGDLIALVRPADGPVRCINSTGAYGSLPGGLRPGDKVPITGPLTVTVPGVVAGWSTLLGSLGRLEPAQVLAPAVRLADDGFTVSQGLARTLHDDSAELVVDPGMRGVFFRDGSPLTTGERLVQPALAATLRQLADGRFDTFYRGDLATTLAAGLARLGVPVGVDDLAAHHASVEDPLRARVDGHDVFTAGPNSQGFTILRTAAAVAAAGDRLSDVDIALLAELLYDGDRTRDRLLCDPRWYPVPVAEELAGASVEQLLARASAALRDGTRAGSVRAPRPTGDTVAVSVVGRDGSAVSLIQSVFHAFGSRLLEPDTGLVLHNRGSFFSGSSESPNVVRPGKRPSHTLAPVIVTGDEGTVAAHGTMGGKAQSQVQVQLLREALRGSSASQVVEAPRFVVGGLDVGSDEDVVMAEESMSVADRGRLADVGMKLVLRPTGSDDFGHAMIARRDGHGELSGGADPRSDGSWAQVSTSAATGGAP